MTLRATTARLALVAAMLLPTVSWCGDWSGWRDGWRAQAPAPAAVHQR